MWETTMLRDESGNGGGRPSVPRNVLGDRLEVCSMKTHDGVPSRWLLRYQPRRYRQSHCLRSYDRGVPGVFKIPRQRSFNAETGIQEALEAGQAPRVVLRATHEGALGHCSLADLKRFAVDLA
jgi:uncharacterized protein